MTQAKNLGWIFSIDGHEGIPHVKCPYCGRVVSGRKLLYASEEYKICPDCKKEVNFENMGEDDWLYINLYYGRRNNP